MRLSNQTSPRLTKVFDNRLSRSRAPVGEMSAVLLEHSDWFVSVDDVTCSMKYDSSNLYNSESIS